MLISSTNSFNNPKTTSEDKIDFLMNKVTQLEEAFKEERKFRFSAEEELKNLKIITIKNLQKQLEEKESMLKTLFIEKIQVTKELFEYKKNNTYSNQVIIKSIENGKNDSLKSNKLEYYSNAYKDLRRKYNEIFEEKAKIEQETESRINLEKKKIEITNDELKSNEDKLERYNRDLKTLSESNKNLLVEIKSLNNLLDEINKQKETLLLENSYFRNEHESSKSNLKDLQLRFRKLEAEYKALSKNLSEMQIKMSNIEISSHIFNVIRVGRLYESNTDLVFTKDENNQMVLIIKYVTTSAKHNILDIKEILFKEGEEHMIMIEFKSDKELRDECFKSSESASIIRVFHEYQKKAYEQMDTKKLEDQKNKKIDNIGANLMDILSFP